MYYNERIKHQVEAQKQENPTVPHVKVMGRVLREAYKNESDETKEAVRKERDRILRKEKEEGQVVSGMLEEPDESEVFSPEIASQ
jgi:hypothetical protein